MVLVRLSRFCFSVNSILILSFFVFVVVSIVCIVIVSCCGFLISLYFFRFGSVVMCLFSVVIWNVIDCGL